MDRITKDVVKDLLTEIAGAERAQGQMLQLAEDIAEAISQCVPSDRNEGELRSALDMLEELQTYTNPSCLLRGEELERFRADAKKDGRKVPPPGSFWFHRLIGVAYEKGQKYDGAVFVDAEQLSRLTGFYLKRPWANCEALEFLLLDAMLYGEIDGFGTQVKENMAGMTGGLMSGGNIRPWHIWAADMIRGTTRWLIRLAICAAVAVFLGDRFSLAVGITAGIVLYQLFYIARLLEMKPLLDGRARVAEFLVRMHALYHMLEKAPVNAAHMREVVSQLAASGAVWPGGVPALLQHAASHGRNWGRYLR